MGHHPIDDVYVNGVPVSKAAIRAYARRTIYDFPDAAALRSYDLDGTNTTGVNGLLYGYDNTDFVTPDDGVNTIVDMAGRRFKMKRVTIAGETVFRQQTIAAGSTATHYKITTNNLPLLSATPVLLIFTPDVNNTGACDLQNDTQAAVPIKRWNNDDPSADELLAGVPVILSITATKATIYVSGANA